MTHSVPSIPASPEPIESGRTDVRLTLFNRPPRILRRLPDDEIAIPGPPQAPMLRTGMRLIGIVIPLASSLIYLAIAAARGSSAGAGALLSALPIVVIGLLTGGAAYYTYLQQKRDYEAALVAYRESYTQALERIRRKLQQLERQQRNYYEENDPDLHVLRELAQGEVTKTGQVVPAARLWERRPTDADFLALRIGRGDRPTSLTIKPPSVNAYSKDVEESLLLADQFRLVRDVPVSVNVRQVGSLGIAGPSGRALNVVQALIWQIVIHHSPNDVRIAAFWESGFDDAWDWLRYLPHTRPLDGDEQYRLLARYDRNPEGFQRVVTALAKELKRRNDDERQGARPYIVVILSDYVRHREAHPLFAQFITAKQHALSTLCLVPEVRDVPSDCGGYIDLNHSGSTEHARLGISGIGGGYSVFKADTAQTQQSRELALHLAPIELAEADGSREMPRNVALLSLLQIPDAASYSPEQAWHDTPADSWHPVPVGAQSADTALEIDLNEGVHGVHGMIAGATGAGKSELLLSFLMALAIRHHPDRLNFLLIDFKGGATFRDLEALPHTAGMVTDLSGFLAERALIAINSELDRRKRALSSNNVPNIKSYRREGLDRRVKPLPNLFIAIDEFDEMIRDYPQFQDELIRVAKQGRSLGVHLLFATQQPSLIKEGLLNNLSYWMSLRVNSKEDSRAMLGVPDAALLGTDTPGRGFLRDKNSGVRMFQSALITSLYRPVAGRSTSEIDATGHISVNTSETRSREMFQIELDSLVSGLKETLTETLHRKLMTETAESICRQFNQLFELHLTPAQQADQIAATLAELQRFLAELKAHSFDTRAISEAEFIEQQIALEAQRLLTLLLGDREQISEIRLIARRMIAAKGARYAAQRYRIWEAPLPTIVPLAEILPLQQAPAKWLDVPYGLMDQPELARYEVLTTDLSGAGGNLLVLGASGSGKTTLLQSVVLALAAAHSPTELWFYLIDSAGSGLGLRERVPHIAHVLAPRQHVLIERLLVELQNQVEDRRGLLQQYEVSSLAQYRERQMREPASMPPLPPALVIVIDNLAELISQNEIVPETLKTLMRESRAYGIYFLASAYVMRDVGALLANFETRIALRLNSDDDSAALIGKNYASRLIAPDQPGRAFVQRSPRPLEAQIALPALRPRKVAEGTGSQAEDAAVAYSDLATELRLSGQVLHATWQKVLHSENPQLPQALRLLPFTADLASLLAEMPDQPAPLVPLGIEGATLQPLFWSLEQTAHVLVTGGPRQGKRSLLRTLLVAAIRRLPPTELEVVLVDYSMRAFRDIERLPHVRRFDALPLANKEIRDVTVVTEKEEFDAVVGQLSSELTARQARLRQGLPLNRRTLLLIHNWDLMAQDVPGVTKLDTFIRRGSDIGLHCVIAYTDAQIGASSSFMRAVRSSCIEVVSGRPPSEQATYMNALRNRFKNVLAGEIPPGRGFVFETGQAVRLVQLAYAGAEYLEATLREYDEDASAVSSNGDTASIKSAATEETTQP